MATIALAVAKSFASRHLDILEKHSDAVYRLISAQMDGDVAKIDAIRAEIAELDAEAAAIRADEKAVEVEAARRTLAQNPNALMLATATKNPREMVRLLNAYEGDAWAESLAREAKTFFWIGLSKAVWWGPEWDGLEAGVAEFVGERGEKVAA